MNNFSVVNVCLSAAMFYSEHVQGAQTAFHIWGVMFFIIAGFPVLARLRGWL